MSVLVATRRALLGAQGIRWLLRDEFSDTRAAGAVNGTPATPGPGTRAIVDTGNLVSVASGWLEMEDSNSGTDPLFALNAVTRVAGRTMLARINPNSTGVAFRFGYAAAQNGATTQESFHSTPAVLYVYENAILRAIGAPILDAITSDVAIVLRAAGIYAFVKLSGENWTLVWAGNTGTTATLYPSLNNYGSQTSYLLFLRIPEALWLPQPIAYSTFGG